MVTRLECLTVDIEELDRLLLSCDNWSFLLERSECLIRQDDNFLGKIYSKTPTAASVRTSLLVRKCSLRRKPNSFTLVHEYDTEKQFIVT